MAGLFLSCEWLPCLDLDGRELIDMSIMGIGTNLLGYGHPEVDAAVTATVAAGNMSTLNCLGRRCVGRTFSSHASLTGMARFARAAAKQIPLRYASLVLPQGEILCLWLSRLA